MFSFFGLFSDPAVGLQEQISGVWPNSDVGKIEKPFAAIGVRFEKDLYQPSDEDIPEAVSSQVVRLSAENPGARFLLLRTECFGGTCANWGHVTKGGVIVCRAAGDGALRRLVSQFGVELDREEVFEPLRRDFPWRLSA